MNYLDNEILESMKSKVFSYHELFTAGRQVKVKAGLYAGKCGVVQNVAHVIHSPLISGHIRVWIDGFSCIDIFDFTPEELELKPLEYINGLGYF